MVSLKKILNKILVRINSEDDYVVEQGHAKGGWDYRKWNSGKAECFLEGSQYYVHSGTAVGNLYRVETEASLPFMPTIFITNPRCVFVSPMDSSVISMSGHAIDSETIKLYGWTTTNGGIYIYTSCYVIGNWK